jgi:putative Holliday junction resolvase
MRYLAVDYGARRIGLAVSDPEGAFASPHSTRERISPRRDIETLVEVVQGLGVEGVVVGVPRALNGGVGESETAARTLAEQLRQALAKSGLNVSLHLWDERFSTREALHQMRASGISQKRGRESVGSDSTDARAASVILQGFLDSRSAENNGENLSRVLDSDEVLPESAQNDLNDVKDLF